MAKDKKKKDKKRSKAANGGAFGALKSLGSSELAADVVAAALVATAAALKDPDKARRFALEAGDQMEKLSKDGAARGGAMWQLALDVGRRALETMTGDKPAKPKRKKAKPTARPKATVAAKAATAKPRSTAKAKTVTPNPRPVAKRKPVAKRNPVAKRKPRTAPKKA